MPPICHHGGGPSAHTRRGITLRIDFNKKLTIDGFGERVITAQPGSDARTASGRSTAGQPVAAADQPARVSEWNMNANVSANHKACQNKHFGLGICGSLLPPLLWSSPRRSGCIKTRATNQRHGWWSVATAWQTTARARTQGALSTALGTPRGSKPATSPTPVFHLSPSCRALMSQCRSPHHTSALGGLPIAPSCARSY